MNQSTPLTQLGVVPPSNAALPMNLRHCVIRSILEIAGVGHRRGRINPEMIHLLSFCESPGRLEHGTESRNTEIAPLIMRESDCTVIRDECRWQTRSYCNRESQVEVQTYIIAIHSRQAK
jgi:hypothetical protein